jgi:hypothetical protein
MKKRIVVSSNEQLAALTRGLSLPLPPLPTTSLRIIADSVVQAFAHVKATHRISYSSGSEPELNALIVARLNDMLEQNTALGLYVNAVSRGVETLNYNGTRLETRPDLSFYLTSRSSRFPLVAEAKVVDAPSGRSVGKYCSSGLARYIVGDYSWGAQEAFLVAYVRDKAKIDPSLVKELQKAKKTRPDPYRTKKMPIALYGSDSLSSSRHARPFKHMTGAGVQPAKMINVWHVWLDAA